MSLNGLYNTQFPLTLDGTTSLDVSSLTIDGQNVNLTGLVPYVGATQTLNMGAQNIQTTHVPVAPNDVVNLDTLTNAVTFVDNSVALTYLNKITTSSQTVAGQVTFNKPVIINDSLTVNPTKTANLASVVDVSPNYKRAETDASVTANYHFGSISNAGGIYTATTTGDYATLGLANLTADKLYKINLYVRAIPTAIYTTSIQLYSSADGTNPGIPLDYSASFNPSSPNTFQLITGNFIIPVGYTQLILLCLNTNNPTYVTPVEWYGLELFDMGVALTNASMPSQTADRVLVLNDKKQVVASGINTTKLGYLDNVSSDIQTQLNSKASTTYVDTGLAGKLDLSGSNANQNINLGSFKVQSNATPTASTDYITKAYGDSTYATTSALSGYLPLTGGTLSGALTISSGALTANTRLLGVPDAVSGGNFWIGLTGSDSEVNRLAISLIGNQTTGTCSGVSISKSLTVSDGLETNISNALKVTQTLVSSTLAAFSTSGVLAPTLATVPSPPPPFVWYASGGLCIGLQVSGWTPGFSYTRYKFVFTNCGRYDIQGPTTLQWFQGSLSAPISASFLLPLTSSPGTITGYFTPSNIGGTIFCAITSSVGSSSFLYYQSFALYRADTNIYSLRAQDNAYFAGDQVVSGTTTTTGITVDGTSQLRNTFIRTGYYLVCNNGNNAGSESDKTQIAFAWHGTTNEYRHRITSEHQGGDGPTGNGNSLNFYLWSNSNQPGDLGTNHRMTIAGAGVGIATTNPTATLDVTNLAAAYDPTITIRRNTDDGNIYAFSFYNQTNCGFGPVQPARGLMSPSSYMMGHHITASAEWGVLSDGWRNCFSVRGGTGEWRTNTNAIGNTNPPSNQMGGYCGITVGGANTSSGYWIGIDSGGNTWAHSLAPSVSWRSFRSRAYDYQWLPSGGGSFTIYNNGTTRIDRSGGADFLTFYNSSYSVGEYINIRFNHNDTRSCYIQSYLPGSNRAFLKFFTADSGGGVAERLTLQDDFTVVKNDLYVERYQYMLYNNQSINNCINNTDLRLQFRDSDGWTRFGQVGAWQYQNNAVQWTGGVYISYCFYKRRRAVVIFTPAMSFYTSGTGFVYITLRIICRSTNKIAYETTYRQYMNITYNHTLVTIPVVVSFDEADDWCDFQAFASGSGVTSDINDTIWWNALVIG